MKNLGDFDIRNFFETESFTGIGEVEDIIEKDGSTIYKTQDALIAVTRFGNAALRVSFSPKEEGDELKVPHAEPSREERDGYEIILPGKGNRFSISAKREDEEILSPFAPGSLLGFLNLGDEFYETFTRSKEKGMVRTALRIPSDHGIYGLGENFTTFNKRGRVLYTFPHDNYCLGARQVYKGVPFFMSDCGVGIVFEEYSPLKFDFGETMEGLILVTSPRSTVSFYILLGTPAEILKQFFTMFGLPEMPPEWSFGMWVSRWAGIGYKSVDEVSDVLAKFKENQIPLDVISMDPQWLQDYVAGVTQACDFQWDRANFAKDDDLGNMLKGNGKRLCLWVNPYVLLNGKIAESMQSCLLKDSSGEISLVPKQDRNPYKPDRGMVDFTRKECFNSYSDLVRDLMIRSNADAVMTDFGETVPIDSVDTKGNEGFMLRNLLGDLYQESAYAGVKAARGKGMIWGRSGSILSHNYPIQWGGDSNSTWEGMRTALRAALSASMSGTVFAAFDTGGFAGMPDPILYIRWAAMGALFSHFKLHGTSPREPWTFDGEIVKAFRELVCLRYSLMPYIVTQAKKSIESGKPLVRPLLLEYDSDKSCQQIDDQYFLGDDLMIAPIFNSTGKRKVYLPEGEWIDYYDSTTKEGGRWIEVSQPISRIPIFVRDGAEIEIVTGSPDNVEEALALPRTKKLFGR